MAKEILVENLPMHINLGDFHRVDSHIGWAKVVHDTETGKSIIEISLDEKSSEALGNMVEVADLKAIGFAGIYRHPEPRYSKDDQDEGEQLNGA